MYQRNPGFALLRIRVESPGQIPQGIDHRTLNPLDLLHHNIMSLSRQNLKTQRNLPAIQTRPQSPRQPHPITRAQIGIGKRVFRSLKRNGAAVVKIDQRQLIMFAVGVGGNITKLSHHRKRKRPFIKPCTDIVEMRREQILNL